MPAKSRPLGFRCHGVCGGQDYGSVILIPTKYEDRSRKDHVYSARRALSNRNSGVHRIGERPSKSVLNSVEYNLENCVLKHIEDTQLRVMSDSLADPRFYSMFKTLPYAEKQKLLSTIRNTILYIDKKDEYHHWLTEELAKTCAKYEVTEEIDSLDPKAYELTKKLGRQVFQGYETVRDDFGRFNRKLVIKWNPVREIMLYRQNGDPFRYINFDMLDFVYAVLGSKSPVNSERKALFGMFKGEGMDSHLRKGFDVINRYRKQFFDNRWRYKWDEWFWVVRYSQIHGPRAASSMLLALDGREGKARISSKYIRDRVESTINFWNDFLEYSPYFHNFLDKLLEIVRNDPELMQIFKKNQITLIDDDNNKILTEKDEDYVLELGRLHIERMSSYKEKCSFNPHEDDMITCKLMTRAKEQVRNRRDDSNKRDLIVGSNLRGPDRIRIYHSNPNFKKEMEEYNRRIKKKKPRKIKAVCGPFDPWPLISNHLTKESYDKQDTELARLARKLIRSLMYSAVAQ